ncbi:hypothetical protein GGF31_006787 [Allomyces arbusculus]|nr:hypothetical protein GGF31_006787 [Allomyces arbusculus]
MIPVPGNTWDYDFDEIKRYRTAFVSLLSQTKALFPNLKIVALTESRGLSTGTLFDALAASQLISTLSVLRVKYSMADWSVVRKHSLPQLQELYLHDMHHVSSMPEAPRLLVLHVHAATVDRHALWKVANTLRELDLSIKPAPPTMGPPIVAPDNTAVPAHAHAHAHAHEMFANAEPPAEGIAAQHLQRANVLTADDPVLWSHLCKMNTHAALFSVMATCNITVLPHLTTLHVLARDDQVIAPLPYCPNLMNATFMGVIFTSERYLQLAEAPRLTTLKFVRCRMGNPGTGSKATMNVLKQLVVRRSDEILAHLIAKVAAPVLNQVEGVTALEPVPKLPWPSVMSFKMRQV